MKIFLMTLSFMFYVMIMILNVIIIGDGLHKWFGIDHNLMSVTLSGLLLFTLPSAGLIISLFCAVYAPNQPLFVYLLAYIPLLLILLDMVYAVPLPQALSFENFNLMHFLRKDQEKSKPAAHIVAEPAAVKIKPVLNKKTPVKKAPRKVKTVKKLGKRKKI